ncbi:hypothetical protein KEM55_000418 [Ascosphaera atra]|nr:hypothetical protein KEM55_000418 [Ascosphaera atra]
MQGSTQRRRTILHITLPTLRMVILADELLEQFFESFFPQSFHLSDSGDADLSRTPSTLSSNLTTFSNIGSKGLRRSGSSTFNGTPIVGASGGIVPPGNTGLRGVLDNIVSDGMRMAVEVKKKMDEAQRELERNAQARGVRPSTEDDDEEDEYYDSNDAGPRPTANAPTRQADLDLLEGAEVESLREREDRGSEEGGNANVHNPREELAAPTQNNRRRASDASTINNKVVEFDS